MSSHYIVFDCETGPLPLDYLDMIAPEFEAPANYKDPDKIAASIAEQKLRWIDRAALSPMTGRVICIGIRDLDDSFVCMDGGGDEAELLRQWTALVQQYKGEQFVGFNIHGFDLPFLMRRSWRLGVKPCFRPGVDLRRLSDWTDLRTVWQMGDKQAEGSLDSIAKFFGIGEKGGSGKDFAGLWESDRDAAMEYLRNDIRLTHAIGEKMGVIV